MTNHLTMWTGYVSPKDYPDHFVVRPFAILPGRAEPGPVACLYDTIEELHDFMSATMFLTFIPPDPRDEGHIIGVWI